MDHPPDSRLWTEETLTALWREHRGWVAAVLYAHAPRPMNGMDVNDLLQEVAVSLVSNVHQLSSPEKVKPWLRTVAMNVARDAGRRQQVRRRTHNVGDGLDALPMRESHDPAAEDESRVRGRRALEIVHELPADYREPLLLNVRGLSHKQIADVLELTVSAVETRVFRARAMVRQELERVEQAENDPSAVNCQPHKAARSLKVSSET